jgi:hypothetical protein
MAFPSVPESSSYLQGVLFGSWVLLALRWMLPGIILGEVDVDGLACPLHGPTTHSCQAMGHGLSTRRCSILSLQ